MNSSDVKNIFANLILPGGILLGGVVFDLRTRKVPNQFVLSAFIFAILLNLLSNGFSSIWSVLGSVLAAFVFALPIYLFKAIGGGDFKLIIAVSPFLTWEAVGTMIMASLLWGSLLGVFSAITHGQLKSLSQNLVGIVMRAKTQTLELHKIPFTVAILFGWITQVTLQNYGVSLL